MANVIAAEQHRPAVVHQLLPSHRPDVERFLVSLDPDTRSARFGGALSDDAVRRYVKDAIRREILFGAFADGRLCGLGELSPESERAAEAAFAVAPDQRRRGIGTALLRAMSLAAANRGIGVLRVAFSHDNAAMRGLALAAGGRTRHGAGQVWADIALPARTPLTLYREAWSEWFGWVGHALQRPFGVPTAPQRA